MISTMKLKRFFRQGCQLFIVSVEDLELEDSRGMSLDDYPLLKGFSYVFPSEILGMLPKRDIDFRIDLVPEAEPIPQALY